MANNNLDRFKKDLDDLLNKSARLQVGFLKETNQLDSIADKKEILEKIKPLDFRRNYEMWYTEACQVIKQLIPDRLNDFMLLYKNDKRKQTDYLTYTISDAIIGLRTTRSYETVVDSKAAFPKFQQQIDILKSAERKFESSLFDIKQIIQSDLFDSELDAARELHKKGFLRGSGAICGVVLERHLKQVATIHGIAVKKTNPCISDLNELLKKEDVIDIPNWRFIQHLGDIRNLCDHNKEREPKKEEIDDLINGVDKVIKTIF
jgi:hypothetical protein